MFNGFARETGSFPVLTRSLILYENTAISHFSSKQKHWEEAMSCAEHSAVLQQLEEQRCWCALQTPKWSFEKQGGRDYVRAGKMAFLIPNRSDDVWFFQFNLLSCLLSLYFYKQLLFFFFFSQNNTGQWFSY